MTEIDAAALLTKFASLRVTSRCHIRAGITLCRSCYFSAGFLPLLVFV